jgi:catechol 2,3-dioxygenase-like lactoylglutathione lyase family enzyme
MITGIAHVCLSAKDLSAAEHFYCQVLGLQKRFEFTRKGQVVGFYLNVAGRMFIEVFSADSVPLEAGVIRHLCLETEDIDGMIAQIQSRGGGHLLGKKSLGADHSWQIWIKAPDGVDIEFHQYTPQSCQTTGSPCEVDW